MRSTVLLCFAISVRCSFEREPWPSLTILHPTSYLLLRRDECWHPMLNALHFEAIERGAEEANRL